VGELDPRHVSAYFERRGTVAAWWTPEQGPLAFHYRAELRVIEEQMAIDPAWQVLDVGTGRGRFALHFAARGCRVLGVDVNPEMIELARASARRAGLEDRFEVRAGDAGDLRAYPDGHFDVVLCMELFDHLPNLDRALEQVHRVLRPGGRLVFTYVPSESLYGMLGNTYRAVRRRVRRGDPAISRTYSFAEVRARLDDRGFALDRYWGIGVLCLNAQTRVFSRSGVLRALDALARFEARRRPYYESRWWARRGAHVVGIATRKSDAPRA
jgi:2-polyprenyl-3-methyl-5-hydroxy-6-metoxy-1,4-benzoquinol methylase